MAQTLELPLTPDFAFELVNNELKIKTKCDLYSYSLYDATGRIIVQDINVSKNSRININTLYKGIYILKCNSQTETQVFKFIQVN